MKSIYRATFFLLSASFVALVGCARKDSYLLDQDFLVLSANATNEQSDAALKIADMAPTDVIVEVNGVRLTKETYEQLMLLRHKSILEKKGMTDLVAGKEMESFRQTYIKNFVAQRLLVDDAFAKGVVTTNEVRRYVEDKIAAIAKSRGKSPQEFVRSKGDDARFWIYEMSISYVMDKLVAKQIPPKAEVTPEFIDEVKKRVAAINAESTATNELMRARLKSWRDQIVSKNEDFLAIAAKVSDSTEENPSSDDGIWGEFEIGDFDSPEFNTAVFNLPEGGISDVLEDDNGYHVVKVLSIIPPVKDAHGRTLERERRKLSHIYLDKAPLLMEESDVLLTQDMKHQMQMQAVNEYVSNLSTNGSSKISYPHGMILF